jgi:hypothetical protein
MGKEAPFLGAQANWVDPAEADFNHMKADVALLLRRRLSLRMDEMKKVNLSTDAVVNELRRQMAECAVDGNLLLAGELADKVWDMLSKRKDGRL